MELNMHELKLYVDDDYREKVLKNIPSQSAQELLEASE